MSTWMRVAVHFKNQTPERAYADYGLEVTSGTPAELVDKDGLGIKQHKGKIIDQVFCEGEIGVKFAGLREGTTIQKRTFPGSSQVAGVAEWQPIKPYTVTEQTTIYGDVPA